MLPKLLSIPMTSLMRNNEIQTNKSIIKVVTNACDATNRLLIEPGDPQPLPIRVPVNLYIPQTWSKSLTTRPIRHDWNLI
jgi:hypothetical protein